MDNKSIREVFNSITSVDDSIWDEFEQYLSTRTLKKNEYLWREGDVCKQLVLLQKGAVRLFDTSNLEGKEHTLEFFFEGKLFTDYYSFITQKPCNQCYQAMEDSELVVIPRIVVYDFYQKYKSFETIGRHFAELNFLGLLENHVAFKNNSPEEAYIKLINDRPYVLERVPLVYIASKIGITPEHLSRIRKKITINT